MAAAAPPEHDQQQLLDTRLALNRTLLRVAAAADLPAARECIAAGADPWFEDDAEHGLGWSALHLAVAANAPELVRFLLTRGALWNAVDPRGATAADLAWSLNYVDCYQLLLEEGVRHTMLMHMLRGDDDDDDDEEEDGTLTLRPPPTELANSNTAFLSSRLIYLTDDQGKERCLDADANMVMAAWETDIMQRTARLLCAHRPRRAFSVLNVGFGLGIVDRFFHAFQPARHVILEPHPDAVAFLRSKGWADRPGVEVVEKRWEDAVRDPGLGTFDVVYFDTYSQDYNDLRKFFDEVPALLSGPDAHFSFFHGLAGTNAFFYDVYTRLSELDLRALGLRTAWHRVHPQLTDEVWKGVRREYWSLPSFLIPVCGMNA